MTGPHKTAEKVNEHLWTLPDADVDVTLEIRSGVPDGVTDDVVKTLRENAKSLQFKNSSFERG